jgi:hypothetical protein
MNLDDVLREPRSASLVDHDWWVEGLVKDGQLTYDPSENYKDNNKKDDLEIEWGYGTIQPQYADDDTRVPAGGVERNIPAEALADAAPVIMFARDLMNRGFMGAELQRQLKANFQQNNLRVAAGQLRELFKLEGIIGRIAVDTRGYDNSKLAIAAIQNNPFKRFIKYAVTEPRAREDYAWLPDTRENDDFFSSTVEEDKGRGHKASMIPHCKQTMLPIYAGMGDLDKSILDDTLIEVMNVTPMTDAEKNEIVNNDKYATNAEKLQAVFRSLDRRATASKQQQYAKSVDVSEFMIESSEQEIEIMADMSMPDIDVDPVNHCLQNQFDVNQAPTHLATAPLDVSIFGEMTEVILANQPTINPLDINLDGFGGEIAIDQQRVAQAPMRIQEREIDGMSILDEAMRFNNASATPEVQGLHHSMTVPVDKAPAQRGAFDLFEESNGQMDGLISFDGESLHIAELDSPMEVELNDNQVMSAAIDVDVFGNEMNFGIMDEVVAQDVSIAQHEDPNFIGGDISFDEAPVRSGGMEVELGSSMEW